MAALVAPGVKTRFMGGRLPQTIHPLDSPKRPNATMVVCLMADYVHFLTWATCISWPGHVCNELFHVENRFEGTSGPCGRLAGQGRPAPAKVFFRILGKPADGHSSLPAPRGSDRNMQMRPQVAACAEAERCTENMDSMFACTDHS